MAAQRLVQMYWCSDQCVSSHYMRRASTQEKLGASDRATGTQFESAGHCCCYYCRPLPALVPLVAPPSTRAPSPCGRTFDFAEATDSERFAQLVVADSDHLRRRRCAARRCRRRRRRSARQGAHPTARRRGGDGRGGLGTVCATARWCGAVCAARAHGGPNERTNGIRIGSLPKGARPPLEYARDPMADWCAHVSSLRVCVCVRCWCVCCAGGVGGSGAAAGAGRRGRRGEGIAAGEQQQQQQRDDPPAESQPAHCRPPVVANPTNNDEQQQTQPSLPTPLPMRLHQPTHSTEVEKQQKQKANLAKQRLIELFEYHATATFHSSYSISHFCVGFES